MKIRKANRKDIEEIVKLNIQLIDYEVKFDKYYKAGKETAKIFRKHLKENINKKNFRIFVAENLGEIVGFFLGRIAVAKSHVVPKKVGVLDKAFVIKKFRNSGIGRAMFKEFLKWFRKNKIKNIELQVLTKNKLGHRSWTKFGFREFYKGMRLDL